MAVPTHCLPTGELAAGAIPCSRIVDANISTYLPDTPPYRGIVIYLHPLLLAERIPLEIEANSFVPFLGANNTHDLLDGLLDDGWIVIYPPYPEDYWSGDGGIGGAMTSDIGTDPELGLRWRRTTDHWFDHVRSYLLATYGDWPLVLWGASWGGLHTLMLAQDRRHQIAGYVAHIPATVVSNIATTIGAPSLTDTSGCDADPHCLDNVTVPGLVSYGVTDPLVGYGIPGDGTVPNDGSYLLPHSNADLIIVNAQAAGAPVTRLANSGGHQVSSATVTAHLAWFASDVDPDCPKTLTV